MRTKKKKTTLRRLMAIFYSIFFFSDKIGLELQRKMPLETYSLGNRRKFWEASASSVRV